MEFDTDVIVMAFALTLFAGLATGIGSALAFFAKTTNTRFLSLSLGFSAGVMLYVSFVEIFVKARDALMEANGEKTGTWITVASFFGGMILIALIDKLVPSHDNPHEVQGIEAMQSVEAAGAAVQETQDHEREKRAELLRMGLFSALAIGIHNFPEGLATFTSALQDPGLGLSIAVAIAIHNIPEGVAVSVPIYYSTGDKKKAFLYSFLSGLSEPVGALVGFLILLPFFTPTLFGILFAAVAGIMVFISLDELLPAAQRYGEHHLSIHGMVAGMLVMAVSLLLFL